MNINIKALIPKIIISVEGYDMSKICYEVNEYGTIIFECNFIDENGDDVIPTSCFWSLYDEEENIINGRYNVEVLDLDSTINISLTNIDTSMLDSNYPIRILKVEATYDSEFDEDLNLEEEAEFRIIPSKINL